MWFRTGFLALAFVSLAVFVVLAGGLVWLFAVVAADVATGGRSAAVTRTLLVVVLAVFAAVLALSVFQIGLLFVTRPRADEERKRAWIARFGAALWSGEALPDPEGDRAARSALLELRDVLRGPAAHTVVAAYRRFGFLEVDLERAARTAPWRSAVEAIERLALLRSPDAAPVLQRRLRHGPAPTRLLALRALARSFRHDSAEPVSRERIVALFWGPLTSGVFGRGVVEATLATLGDNAAPLLERVLRGSRDVDRIRTALDVVARNPKPSWAALCAARLEHDDPEVRAAALRALAATGGIPVEAQPSVMRALRDEVDFVRIQAVKTFAALPRRLARTLLLAALGDRERWVRHNAAHALLELGDVGRDALVWARAHHRDAFARDAAEQTLDEWMRTEAMWRR